MKHIAYRQLPASRFDAETVKGVSGRVAIGQADGAANFCMRVFEVAENGYTPRHRHPWEHEIFVHAGHGEVFDQGRWVPIAAGDALFIPANEEHQIRNAAAEPLVFVCLIPAGVPEL